MNVTTGGDAPIAAPDIARPEDIAQLREKDPRLGRLGVGLKSAYGLGSVVDTFTNTTLANFFLFYVTAVCGLSGTLAGLSVLIALIIDAVADPAIGLWSDNSSSRYGRRHPFMLASILPLSVSFGLLFSVPTQLTGWALFAFVTVVALVLRFSMSLFLLPYIALGAELTDDYIERSTIVGYRVLFATLANFAVFGLILAVYLPGQGGVLHRAGYTPFGWTGAAILLASGLAATFGTRSVIPRLHKAAPFAGSVVLRFLRELGEIFRNQSFVTLFVGVLICFVAQGAASSLSVHAYNYFWVLPPWAIQAVFFGLALGPVAGIPLTAWASRHVEKRMISVTALLIFCTTQFFMPLAKLAGLLPTGGPALFGILVGNSFVLGAMLVVITIAFQSMLADAADEHEYLFGTRREGLFYAGLSLSAKAAGGVGAFIAGRALDLIHFPSNIANLGPHFHVAADTVRNLGFIIGPLPALMTLAGTWFIYRYRLTRAKHADILVELNVRRGG